MQDFCVWADLGFMCRGRSRISMEGQTQDLCAGSDILFLCRGQIRDFCVGFLYRGTCRCRISV